MNGYCTVTQDVSDGTPLGSVKMQSAQLRQATGLKYIGSTLQSDGDMNAEVNKMEQLGEDIRGHLLQDDTTTL